MQKIYGGNLCIIVIVHNRAIHFLMLHLYSKLFSSITVKEIMQCGHDGVCMNDAIFLERVFLTSVKIKESHSFLGDA